ncbi:MAG: CvpA family protein [Clostridia bacterium]|nr:CvpA family protein [Clostridia bacterium]
MKLALDIGVAVIIALFVFLGVRKGFLRTVIGLAGMVAVFLLVYYVSTPLGNALDKGFINSAFRNTAANRIARNVGVELQTGDKEEQLEGFETEIEQYNETNEDGVLTILGFGREKIKQAAAEASGSFVKGIFSLVDKASAATSKVLAVILLIIGGFLLVALVKILIRPLLKALHLGAFDSVLGGVLGAARGIIIVLLVAFVVRLALPAIGGTLTRDDIESTIFFKHAYHLVDGE